MVGDMHGGGMHDGGHAWQGVGMHGRGACVVGGRHAWQGACMAGVHAWQIL